MPANKNHRDPLVRLTRFVLFTGWMALSGAGIAAAAKIESVDGSSTGPAIKPRYEQSSDEDRVIFDFAGPVYHSTRLVGDQVIIWFDRPVVVDVDALRGQGQSRLLSATAAGRGASQWVVLDVRPGSSVRSLTTDDHVVVITIEGTSDAAPSAAEGVATGKKTWSPRKRQSSETEQTAEVRSVIGPADTPPDRSASGTIVDGVVTPVPTPSSRPSTQTTGQSGPDQETASASRNMTRGDDPLPGQFDIDEDALDRALERTLTRVGALLLPAGMAEIEPSFGYLRRESRAPTQVDLFGLFAQVRETEIRRDEVSAGLAIKAGLPLDSQVEISLPLEYVAQKTTVSAGFTALQDSSSSSTGFGDLSVGLAKSILQEKAWWPDIVGRLRWDTATGRSEDGDIGLGGGRHELIGSLSFVKSQDPLAFVGSISYQKSFEKDGVDPGDRIGLSIGTVLAAGPDTSLRLSLSQSFADDARVDGKKVPGSDEISASVNMGASSVLGQGILLDASVSAGLTEDAPDYALRFALPIRFRIPRRFYVTMLGNEVGKTSVPAE